MNLNERLGQIRAVLDEIENGRVGGGTPSIVRTECMLIVEDVLTKMSTLRGLLVLNASSSNKRQQSVKITLNDGGEMAVMSPERPIVSPDGLHLPKLMITRTSLNDDDSSDPIEIAQTAFDNENYAKCVRVVEKSVSDSDGSVCSELFLLGNNAYLRMVEAGSSDSERAKLCDWWRVFLGSIRNDLNSTNDRLLLIDCQIDCLWQRYLMQNGEQQRIRCAQELLSTRIAAYEIAAQHYRPFHLQRLRRIERLCRLMQQLAPAMKDLNGEDFQECITLSRNALTEAETDSAEFSRDSGLGSEEDNDSVESLKLIGEAERILDDLEGRDRNANEKTVLTNDLANLEEDEEEDSIIIHL